MNFTRERYICVIQLETLDESRYESPQEFLKVHPSAGLNTLGTRDFLIIKDFLFSIQKQGQKAVKMARLSNECRRVIMLCSKGYSVTEIRRRLKEENISISRQALYNLVNKLHKGTLFAVDGQPR